MGIEIGGHHVGLKAEALDARADFHSFGFLSWLVEMCVSDGLTKRGSRGLLDEEQLECCRLVHIRQRCKSHTSGPCVSGTWFLTSSGPLGW